MSDDQQQVPIAVIGGSGLYDIEGLDILEERTIETPYGDPSAPITIGQLGDRRVAFLPRHGKHHELNPSQVPYQANIWALKSLGVFWINTVSAVGSLREEMAPGHVVVPDQIIDKTYRRPNTLYEGMTVHVNLGQPFEPALRRQMIEACRAHGVETHDHGTYVCMEGPAFSTVAESQMHRQWGAHLIGMTAQPEARLAREAEMAYATIALVTDYDVWYERDTVDVAEVLEVLRKNAENVRGILARLLPAIPLGAEDQCLAHDALQHAILTAPEAIAESTRRRVSLFLGDRG